jgi:hypothetical protein
LAGVCHGTVDGMQTWSAPVVNVFYRPPAGSTPTLVRTDRPGRLSRYHRGAILDGELLIPEACNLTEAARITDLGNVLIPAGAPEAAICRRCFR